MADKPHKTERAVPAPILLAQQALKVLEAEGSLKEGLDKSLSGFAMQLSKAGTEVTLELLLERARSGEMEKAAPEQKTKTYADVIALLEGKRTEEQKIVDLAKNGDLEGIKKAEAEGKFRAHLDQALEWASYNGHIEVVEYLVEELRADVNAEGRRPLAWAAAGGHLEVVEYLVHRGAHVFSQEEEALLQAIRHGNMGIIKYLVEEKLANVHARDDESLRIAIKENRFEVVKYLVEERGMSIHANKDYPVMLAAYYGHLDMVKYFVEKGADLYCQGKTPLLCAAEQGHLDTVKYLAELSVGSAIEIDTDNMDALRGAIRCSQPGIIKYLVEEQHVKTDSLSANEQELFEKILDLPSQWKKIAHIVPPLYLQKENPSYFRPKAFEAINEMIRREKDYKEDWFNRVVFAAAGLFGTEDRVLKYLEEHGQSGISPLLMIIQYIELPEKKIPAADLAAWADAVIKCGPGMAKLVKYADKLPQPEKSEDGKTWSLVNTRAKVAPFVYARGSENLELAALCLEHSIEEIHFNVALDLAQKAPAVKNIPELVVEGKKFDMEGAKFYRLAPDDVRGLFLGEIVNCCQSIGKVGDACAREGFTSQDDGFYVVENAKGKIIGQTWAWLGKKGELVFDSLETLGRQVSPLQWEKLTKSFAQALRKTTDISALQVGFSGYAGTPKEFQQKFRKSVQPAIPLDDHPVYRDSEQQLVVWKRRKPTSASLCT